MLTELLCWADKYKFHFLTTFILFLCGTGKIKAQAPVYDLWTITTGSSPDTSYMRRYTDSIFSYNWSTGQYVFVQKVNPRRYTPWQLLDAVPAIIADTTGLANNISSRLLSSNFTKAAMVALGMLAVSDTGRAMTNVATGYDLNKVRDSVQANIPTNNNQLSNGSAYITQAGARTSLSAAGTGISYNSSTGVFTSTALDTTSLSNRINAKQNTITTGSSSQYIDGTLALRTFPTSNLQVYDSTGLLSSTGKLFSYTFSVSTATPTISLSSYLSAMGCSNFKIVSATGYRTGATTGTSPNITITGTTSNSVSLICNQTNTATVTILGINVLSGLPTILVPDPTNIRVVLSFYAW